MPDRELLESYALYRRKEIMLPPKRDDWPKPALKAYCHSCRSEQTFNMINDYQQYDGPIGRMVAASQATPPSSTVRLVYACAACERSRRYFLIVVSVQPRLPRTLTGAGAQDAQPATVFKAGQQPAYDIQPDPKLAEKLGKRLPDYKKGVICESQAYGIGAFAYYRRIVEEMIDELLDEMLELVPAEEREEYTNALEQTRTSRNASDKIDVVKHLIPPELRPGGANPLALLHGVLSEGIHALPDEECLERAVSIREVLVFVVHQLMEARTSARRFEAHLQKLLDKRTARAQD